MEFTVNRDVVAKAISTASSLVTDDKGSPLSGSMLFESLGEGKMRLTGRDSSCLIRVLFDADASDNFSSVLPIRPISQLVKLMGEEIKFEMVDGKLIVKSGKSRHRFGVAISRFPEIDFDDQYDLVIDSAIFKDMLKKIDIATSKYDAGKWLLRCVNFVVRDRIFELQASDGRCVGTAVYSVDSGDVPVSALVPSTKIAAIVKLLGNDDTANLKFINGNLQVTIGDVSTNIIGLSGLFPDANKLTRVVTEKFVTVDCDDLNSAMKRCTVSADFDGVVNFDLYKTKITLASRKNRPEIGEGEDEIEVSDSYGIADGEVLKFAVFASQLTKYLAEFNGDVKLEFSNTTEGFVTGPIRIASLSDLDYKFDYVTSPMLREGEK